MALTNKLEEQLGTVKTLEEAKAIYENAGVELTDEQMDELSMRCQNDGIQELSEDELENINGGRRRRNGDFTSYKPRYHKNCGGKIFMTQNLFGYHKCTECGEQWFWTTNMLNDSYTKKE